MHVQGECNNYIFYVPHVTRNVAQNTRPSFHFSGEGSGDETNFYPGSNVSAHGMGMRLSFYVWQSWIEIIIWNENENSCMFATTALTRDISAL